MILIEKKWNLPEDDVFAKSTGAVWSAQGAAGVNTVVTADAGTVEAGSAASGDESAGGRMPSLLDLALVTRGIADEQAREYVRKLI